MNDLEETARAQAAAGIDPERFDRLGQEDRGVWATADGAQILWYKDPDDNIQSVTQSCAG